MSSLSFKARVLFWFLAIYSAAFAQSDGVADNNQKACCVTNPVPLTPSQTPGKKRVNFALILFLIFLPRKIRCGH